MTHRSLTIDPPTEMLVPLHTAVRLLRIMLSINLVLAMVGIVFPGLYFGMGASVLVALTSWPTALVWVFVMLPGLTRRLGRYYLPVCIVLTIAAQSIENGLGTFLNPRTFERARDFFAGRSGGDGPFGFGGMPFEARAVEPLFLIIAATVLGAWAYGRRGGYATTGLAAVLLLVSNLTDIFGGGEARLVFPLFAFRVTLILVVGYIVGTLAEQERKQTIELSAANTKLREQTSAIEQLATARERNRLARDLHDTLAHSLAGLVVQLGAIDTLMQAEPGAARAEVATARKLAQTGLQEARHAIRDLRANPVEDLGLARALERAALDFGERSGVQIDLNVSDPKAAIPNETAAQILRIAQEALNNVERHAGARRVGVTLAQKNGGLKLNITDDGRGFDDASIGDERFGLTGMRERAEMIGAELKVDSTVGRGTTVQLTMAHDQFSMKPTP